MHTVFTRMSAPARKSARSIENQRLAKNKELHYGVSKII